MFVRNFLLIDFKSQFLLLNSGQVEGEAKEEVREEDAWRQGKKTR